MKAKYIIGGLVIVVFAIWGGTALMKTTIKYVSLPDAAVSDRKVQVMGQIDFDVVNYNEAAERLEFAIFEVDAEPTEAERLKVAYYGIVPGNFDQATSVVLKGMPDTTGVFIADQMLVKCPSKYQGEGGEIQDMTKHDSAVESDGSGY